MQFTGTGSGAPPARPRRGTDFEKGQWLQPHPQPQPPPPRRGEVEPQASSPVPPPDPEAKTENCLVSRVEPQYGHCVPVQSVERTSTSLSR